MARIRYALGGVEAASRPVCCQDYPESKTVLRLLGNSKRLCNGTTRRDLLQIGGLGSFGLALHNIPGSATANAEATAFEPKFGQAKSCILIYK